MCDSRYCIRDKYGKICSGHGDCVCGQCVCHSPWTKDACDCKKDTDKCRSPDSPHLICSNHGSCPCDQCECRDDGNTRYSGEFCEKCETCQTQCTQLRPCVECLAFNSTDLFLNGDEVIDCSELCPFNYAELLAST